MNLESYEQKGALVDNSPASKIQLSKTILFPTFTNNPDVSAVDDTQVRPMTTSVINRRSIDIGVEPFSMNEIKPAILLNEQSVYSESVNEKNSCEAVPVGCSVESLLLSPSKENAIISSPRITTVSIAPLMRADISGTDNSMDSNQCDVELCPSTAKAITRSTKRILSNNNPDRSMTPIINSHQGNISMSSGCRAVSAAVSNASRKKSMPITVHSSENAGNSIPHRRNLSKAQNISALTNPKESAKLKLPSIKPSTVVDMRKIHEPSRQRRHQK